MTALSNLAVFIVAPLVLLLAGYWLAARLTAVDAAERVAVAVIAGLAALLWSVSAINYFQPLSGIWAWACLWPVALTLLSPRARASAGADLSAVLFTRRGAVGVGLSVGVLVFLLWPLLTRPALLFYDGTSNHDSFFWISAAEHLMRHDYLTAPAVSDVRPMYNAVPAITGLRPIWGRMGAEGLLAMSSSLTGTRALALYLAFSASLFFPWVAAVYLATRTFVGRLGLGTFVALILLQPVFVFFHGNANLPNLLGTLCGAAAVVATERALRPEAGRWIWAALIAVSFHGLLCTYPEMIPFTVLPAGLLWLRAWFRYGVRAVRSSALICAAGWVVGTALNPASTVRAWVGFFNSFGSARADQQWANLFDPLSAIEYPAGLASLSMLAAKSLSPLMAGLLTVVLVAGLLLAIRRSQDRWGLVLILSGAGALLAYTLATGFLYGWQKTVQFGGPLWVTVFPVAMIHALCSSHPADRRVRVAGWVMLGAIVVFFGCAFVVNVHHGHKWSDRKVISRDWIALAEHARRKLPDAAILVDARTFRMAFFHGMWVTYFLRDQDLVFSAASTDGGGYVRSTVKVEGSGPTPPIGGYLVARNWADTLDASSPRAYEGDTVVLLRDRNRGIRWSGLQPGNGVPENAEAQGVFEVEPPTATEFVMMLTPRRGVEVTRVRVRNQVDGQTAFATEVSGPPPWKLVVPLAPGKLNKVEFAAEPAQTVMQYPFIVSEVKIQPRTE